jgi:hypothetical protein
MERVEADQERLVANHWALMSHLLTGRRGLPPLGFGRQLSIAQRALEAIARNEVRGGQPGDELSGDTAFVYRVLAAVALIQIDRTALPGPTAG